MVELLIGKKGTGKTKTLLEKVNNSAAVANGNVVFLSPNAGKNMYDIKSCVRVVDTTEFDIKSYAEFLGFLSGIVSGNFDITNIFVDSIFKIVDNTLEGMEEFLERVDAMGSKFNISFVITVSIDEADAPEYIKKYI